MNFVAFWNKVLFASHLVFFGPWVPLDMWSPWRSYFTIESVMFITYTMDCVAVNALSHDVLNWELRTSCPSSGSSLWCQSVRPKRSNNLILSGKSAYPDAWSSAEHHLSDLLGGPAEGLCFYYNCTSQYRSLSELLLPAGRWSRDSNGRLTRQ